MWTRHHLVSQVKTVLVAFVVLVGPAGVESYCPAITPKVCRTFFRSDAVFLATVLSETSVVSADDFIEGWRYRVRVKRVFRGTIEGVVEVLTENTSSRLILTLGRDHLLFSAMRDGEWFIGSDCGPASDESRLAENIREIEQLQRLKTSVIEGAVYKELPAAAGAPGVTITISGMGRRHRLTSGADGQFRLVVSPGRYQVLVDPTIAVPYDLNWIDESDVRLQPGECAQLLYISKPARQ